MKRKYRKYRKSRVKKTKQSPAELILSQYQKICLEKREGGEGYRLSLKDATKRVGKIKGKKALEKFLKDIDQVIFKNHLQNYFPYSQAFHYLHEKTVDKLYELAKIKRDDENWKHGEEYIEE